MKTLFLFKSPLKKILILQKIIALSSMFVACKAFQVESETLQDQHHPKPLGQPSEVFAKWNEHILQETAHAAIQKEGCMPTHFPAKGPSKGIVVLIHGFTACPQQYFTVGPMIADQGFDVFLPLMPGQGRVPKDGLSEDYDVPKGLDEVERYRSFVKTINSIASFAHGTKVIGGLSGGGALAAGAAIEGKNIWNRALLMAPFFKFPHIIEPVTAVIEDIKPDLATTYGEECTEGRKDLEGRRGLCEVTVAAMRTMLRYGMEYRNRLSEVPYQIQFVGAEHDPTIDNGTLFESYQSHDPTRQKSRICFYKKGVPHSMMSRRENKKTGHWWMNSLEKDITQFVTEGVWFPIVLSEKSIEYQADQCLVDD